MPVNVDKIISYIWQSVTEDENVQVLGMLDAAVDDAIYPKLMGAANEKANLFRGEKAQEMAQVAPYLVQFAKEDTFTNWVIDQGWGNHWGIFMQTSADFATLKRHLRSLLQVYDEEGNSLFFRYYDPRVMRAYLPTCTGEELQTFFGPVTHFFLADEDAGTLLCLSRSESGLQVLKKLL